MAHRGGGGRRSFRPAGPAEFEYCAGLYFANMQETIRDLNLDMAAHASSFRQQWDAAQVRIITLDAADIGWLQSRPEGDAIFLAQFFVDTPFRRQGIGTQVM